MTDQIFISYSKKDGDFAHKLADYLEAAGFKIWIDRSIGGGEQWRETIEKNLKAAGDVIIVISPNSMGSEWVKHEGSLAYGWGKQLFPILIEPVESLPPWLEEYQWIDFVNIPHDTAFDALVAALTPPNPIQDLLDMQVAEYEQTGDLISETIFRVIEESYNSLHVSPEAEELIQKSREKIVEDQRLARRRFLRIATTFALAFVVIVIVVTLAFTGKLNRLIYLPVDMDESDYWVMIPAGYFQMGSNETDPDASENEFPQHQVYLETYQIGRYEITNRQYRQCVLADVCPAPFNQLYTADEYADYPVVEISWYNAENYCEWADGRLPTEAEWEKAARGGLEGALYPWGDDPPVCNFGATNGAQHFYCAEGRGSSYSGHTVAVKSFAPNGYGLYDMAGNVWEWTANWYDLYPGGDPSASDWFGETYRVARGGSSLDSSRALRVANRNPVNPDYWSYIIGFRCAQDASP